MNQRPEYIEEPHNDQNPILEGAPTLCCENYRIAEMIRFIGKHYGFNNQIEKLDEELDELKHVLFNITSTEASFEDGDYDTDEEFTQDMDRELYHLAEEMADVCVVIKTLLAEKPELSALVEAFITMKVTRQAYRIATKDPDTGAIEYAY